MARDDYATEARQPRRSVPLDEDLFITPADAPPVQRSLTLAAAQHIPCETGGSDKRPLAEQVAAEILSAAEILTEDEADVIVSARRELSEPLISLEQLDRELVEPARTKPHVCRTFSGFLCNACGLALYPPPGCSADELQCWNRRCPHYEQRFPRPKLDVPATVSID
jgi:hypothetical protein